MNSPWPEWSACLLAAVSAAISFRFGRGWALAGIAVILAVLFTGSAGVLLLPPLAVLLFLLFKQPTGLGRAVVLAGIAAGAMACWLFPEPSTPPLPGPYKVGTRTLEIPAEGENPRLCFQVWYPAEATGQNRAPWLPDSALAPGFPFHRLAKASSRSWSQAPLVETKGTFPVLFYEHAWMGHRAENIAQVEHLASRGFVVIAVDHPGQASSIRYADGTRSEGRLAPSPDFSSDQTVAAFEAAAERCLMDRASDLARVRQALAGNLIPEWKNRLRLDHGGVFGFSFGGTTAIRLCARDPWFTAGANEDGFFLGTENPRTPFVYFDDEIPAWLKQPATPDEVPEQRLIRRSDERTAEAAKAPESQRLALDGTRHESFTDRVFLCPIPRLAKAGRRPAVEVHRTIASTLAAFFSRELRPGEEAAGTR